LYAIKFSLDAKKEEPKLSSWDGPSRAVYTYWEKKEEHTAPPIPTWVWGIKIGSGSGGKRRS
jgi:hypothetical protein